MTDCLLDSNFGFYLQALFLKTFLWLDMAARQHSFEIRFLISLKFTVPGGWILSSRSLLDMSIKRVFFSRGKSENVRIPNFLYFALPLFILNKRTLPEKKKNILWHNRKMSEYSVYYRPNQFQIYPLTVHVAKIIWILWDIWLHCWTSFNLCFLCEWPGVSDVLIACVIRDGVEFGDPQNNIPRVDNIYKI